MRAIDADALMERLKEWDTDDKVDRRLYNFTLNRVLEQPTIEPERKMGHWERHNTYHGDDVSGFIDPDWRCSECGGQANVNERFMYDLTDFCPNCGADMRGEQNK